MSGSPDHLKRLKSRYSGTPPKYQKMSQREKVDKLEKALGVFRAEVDMKLKIMQHILTNRNEQVAVQKKLLEKEHDLYNTLLVHWANSRRLAATGVSVNLSAVSLRRDKKDKENVDEDYDDGDDAEMETDHGGLEDTHSEPGSDEEEDILASPSKVNKKSRSSLRRDRKSGKSMGTRKSKNQKEDHQYSTVFEADIVQRADKTGHGVLEMHEGDEQADADTYEDDDMREAVVVYKRKDPVWYEFDCVERDPKSRRMTAAACKKCHKILKWPKPAGMRSHVNKCMRYTDTTATVSSAESILPNVSLPGSTITKQEAESESTHEDDPHDAATTTAWGSKEEPVAS